MNATKPPGSVHPDTTCKAPESAHRHSAKPFGTSGRLQRYPSSGSAGSGSLDLDFVIVEPVVLVQKGDTSKVPGISEPERQRRGETLRNRSDSEQVVQE